MSRHVDDYSDAELETIVEGKAPPRMIYHDGDNLAYYLATERERAAWNEYAHQAAATFDANPSLDSYDNHHVYPGRNRDGKYTNWCPPMFFPEWLEEYRARATKEAGNG